MTVGDMLGGGVRLVRTQPKALALWALLYLLLTAALMALFRPVMRDVATFQRAAITGGPAPAATPPDLAAGLIGGVFLLELALVVAIVAIFAAAVRAVASGQGDRFGHLRLGMTEVRLIGLGFLVWLLLVATAIVYALVAAVVTGVLSTAIGAGAAGTVMLLLSLAALALLIWAEVRLSLAGAFTVLRGRITLRPAWRATRDRFWTLLGGYLAIGVVYVAVSTALTAVLFPDLFRLYALALRGADPQTVIDAQQAMMGSLFGPRMIGAIIVGTIVNTALIGWLFGAIATAAVTIEREVHA